MKRYIVWLGKNNYIRAFLQCTELKLSAFVSLAYLLFVCLLFIIITISIVISMQPIQLPKSSPAEAARGCGE